MSHVAVVMFLVAQEEVQVNTKDDHDYSPLSYAAEYGCEVVVKILVGQDGAKVNTKDNDGHLPLFHAVGMGHEVVVKILVTWTPRTGMAVCHCLMPPNMGMRWW